MGLLDNNPAPNISSQSLLQAEMAVSILNSGSPLIFTALPAANLVLPGTVAYTTDQGFVYSTGSSWSVINSGVSAPSFVPVSSFGIVSSATLDQTTAIQNAINAANTLGVGLSFGPGTYVYSNNLTNTVSWIGAGSDYTEMRKTSALGKGANISCTTSGVRIKGITFNSPNTPSSATNDAAFSDTCLIFQRCSEIILDSLVFKTQYGTNAYFETVTQGRMLNLAVYTCYKDGLHVTGASQDIERINCVVENGGDDAFPCVGYVGGNAPGQNVGILDQGNVVRGCKTGAGFKYAGNANVTNVGCKVDGTVPASYGPITTQQSCQALFIDTDTGSTSTLGNEDIQITGFQAINCGRGASPFTTIVSAIQLVGAAGQTTRNVRFTNLDIRNCASVGLLANGGSAGGIDELVLDGIFVKNTSDPNGYTGTAGTASFAGVLLQKVNNFTFRGSISDAGGSGIVWDNSCTGQFDIDLVSYRINASGSAAQRIINTTNSSSGLTRQNIRLFIDTQVAASASTPYTLDRIVYAPSVGITDLLRIEMGTNCTTGSVAIMPASYTNVSITASPMTYTNAGSSRLLALIQQGTATGLTVSRGRGTALSTTAALANTSGLTLTLAPGESLVLTYSSAGTLALQTVPCEGV